MSAERSKQVFICHSSLDSEIAQKICARLEADHIGCWIAPRDVEPSADYAESIIDAISHSTIMILVLSASANHSRHVKNEIERAVSKGKIILPVRIEHVLPQGALELHVATCQWVDVFVPPLESGFARLAASIRILLDKRESTLSKQSESAPVRQSAHATLDAAASGGSQANTAGKAIATGIVTGNRVSLRQKPTVAAKVLRTLEQGTEVLVLDKVTVDNDGECQLKDDFMFKPESGAQYRLRAGKGLLISGERNDSYRIEIRNPTNIHVGYIPKSAVKLLGAASWVKVRAGTIEGWVYSRYIRTF